MERISKLPITIFLLSIIWVAGCSEDKDKLGTPVAGTEMAMSDFAHFWSYYSNHVKFYKDFETFNTDSKPMPADSFMARYKTGEYVVLKYMARDTVIQYKLEKLKPNVEDNIKNQLRSQAFTDYNFYKKRGKPLDGLNFTDLNGKVYNPKNTLGKYVVMKFWFIGCVPCVEEMPELNEMVAKNKDRDDVVFLGIALDPEKALNKFLTKKRFDYHVIGNKNDYVMDTLKINQFPTHLVIDKEGKVMGLCNSSRELKDLIKSRTSIRI
ncbi:TlpA family protein disulfide reductase [Dyadobacter arcticus]|uniref:Peroxiredoxin n=1 Tax=Dyadobacter arcticus TaxID=1078754 RepID=A0ABX0UNC9_9BACT|nr:TlpA disulfide reductase family protein [Dyadobacter arcticus]NIJ54461.1 peroxiredoxin [Dyadobacter arcticus]